MSKYALLCQALATLKAYATSSIYASVSIPGSHPLNKQLLAWLVDQGLGKNARTLALSSPNAVPPGTRGYLSVYEDYPYLYGADGRRARSKRNPNAEEEDRQKQALSYVPEVGTYRFWWKWYPMTFTRQRNVTETTDSKGRVTYMTTALTGKIILGITPMPAVWGDQSILRQLALRCASAISLPRRRGLSY